MNHEQEGPAALGHQAWRLILESDAERNDWQLRGLHGIYFGTNNGFVFASNDEGENWRAIASHLPYVWSVNTAVIDA